MKGNPNNRLYRYAKQMMTAARTAPKARGEDIVETITITHKHIKRLSDAMLES